jgi:hypothetical protein
LDFIEKIANTEKPLSPFIESLKTIANKEIVLEHIVIGKSGSRNQLTGRAPSEQSAINFKNRLAGQEKLSNVSLPLSDITIEPDKSVTFNLSFEIKS